MFKNIVLNGMIVLLLGSSVVAFGEQPLAPDHTLAAPPAAKQPQATPKPTNHSIIQEVGPQVGPQPTPRIIPASPAL